MENANTLTNQENIQSQGDKSEESPLDIQGKNVVAIILTILFIAFAWFVYLNFDRLKAYKDELTAPQSAGKEYIEYCTKEFIKDYLLYPNTFKLESIEYSCKRYDDEGYEIWQTKGYFTSENKFGMALNGSFAVKMKFVYEDDIAYKQLVIIDDEIRYVSDSQSNN